MKRNRSAPKRRRPSPKLFNWQLGPPWDPHRLSLSSVPNWPTVNNELNSIPQMQILIFRLLRFRNWKERFNLFEKLCSLFVSSLSSSFFSQSFWDSRAATAASSASRCTTASPTPSRSGPRPPEISLRPITYRRKEASSTTPNWPTATASSAAASLSRATPARSLSPMETPRFRSGLWDSMFLSLKVSVFFCVFQTWKLEFNCGFNFVFLFFLGDFV